MLEDIGQRIKNIRKDKGLTQKDVADRCYIAPQTVQKWECGINSPHNSIPYIAKALDVSEIDLLFSCDLEEDNSKQYSIEIDRTEEELEYLSELRSQPSSWFRDFQIALTEKILEDHGGKYSCTFVMSDLEYRIYVQMTRNIPKDQPNWFNQEFARIIGDLNFLKWKAQRTAAK